MRRTNTIVIGGGQAGLAMSRCLSDRGVDHVVLERGRIGERWRSERWPSLRLLTPSWQSRLPGFAYRGPDPDGYMAVHEVVDYLEHYACSFAAPIEAQTSVTRVTHTGASFCVATDRGAFQASHVVIATGHCDVPFVPQLSSQLSHDVLQLTPNRYRTPHQLPPGGVLVVGASATGVQLAEEIQRSGRPVTLAVGKHTRLPRDYRGRDILWWLDRMGVLDERAEDLPDLEAARRAPSMQLVGRPAHDVLDLSVLQRLGVRLVGRVVDAEGTRVTLADDLAHTVAAADDKLERLCARVDAFIAAQRLDAVALPPARPVRARVDKAPVALALRDEGIRSIVWATGYRRSYPWLDVPVLDACGEIEHRGGVTRVPGLYVLGLALLRRRKSSFLDGVGLDARELAEEIVRRGAGRRAVVAA